jgi:adenylate kinase
MRVILIGPPGSGKGTQAALLVDRLKLAHISTGNILREGVAEGTPAGKKAEPFMMAGRLAPDEVVNQLVADRFAGPDRPERFVFDGYPRTLPQARALDTVLDRVRLPIDAVVVLELGDDEVVRRISGRRVCPKDQTPYHLDSNPPRNSPGKCDVCGAYLMQRADDREETVRERLRDYHSQTADLIPYYRDKGLLRQVPGRGDIEAISSAIDEAIGATK